MFCGTCEARDRVGTFQISSAHFGDTFRIVSECTADDLRVFPVIGDIADRCESHIASDGSGLFVGHFSEGKSVFFFVGRSDLYAGADGCSVRAGAVSAGLCVAGDKYRDLRVFLEFTVLFLDRLAGSRIVTAAAQVIFLHQFFQIFFIMRSSQLEKKLSDFLFIAHSCDRVFHPFAVLVGQIVWVCFQIYHIWSPFLRKFPQQHFLTFSITKFSQRLLE